MADEQDRWLNRDAAERLLRGEPLDVVDADTRKQADRLAEALGALAAAHPPTSVELPGEGAALAAFREARAGKSGEQEVLGRRGRAHPAVHSADAGLVRLGRPGRQGRRTARWGRPVRFGMAAALAAGMLGGVAVAAGTGVLPTPFGDGDPGPAASAAATPGQPLLSPSPGDTGGAGSGVPSPGDTSGGSSGGGSTRDQAQPGSAASGGPGSNQSWGFGHSREWRTGVLSSCRAVRDGKDLDAGRRRTLEDAAGGGGRVRTYCKGVLASDSGSAPGGEEGAGTDRGDKSGGDQSDQGDKGDPGDPGRNGDHGGNGGDDDGHHIRPGGDHHRGSGVIVAPSTTPPAALAAARPSSAASPTPTYSTLESPSVPSVPSVPSESAKASESPSATR